MLGMRAPLQDLFRRLGTNKDDSDPSKPPRGSPAFDEGDEEEWQRRRGGVHVEPNKMADTERWLASTSETFGWGGELDGSEAGFLAGGLARPGTAPQNGSGVKPNRVSQFVNENAPYGDIVVEEASPETPSPALLGANRTPSTRGRLRSHVAEASELAESPSIRRSFIRKGWVMGSGGKGAVFTEEEEEEEEEKDGGRITGLNSRNSSRGFSGKPGPPRVPGVPGVPGVSGVPAQRPSTGGRRPVAPPAMVSPQVGGPAVVGTTAPFSRASSSNFSRSRYGPGAPPPAMSSSKLERSNTMMTLGSQEPIARTLSVASHSLVGPAEEGPDFGRLRTDKSVLANKIARLRQALGNNSKQEGSANAVAAASPAGGVHQRYPSGTLSPATGLRPATAGMMTPPVMSQTPKWGLGNPSPKGNLGALSSSSSQGKSRGLREKLPLSGHKEAEGEVPSLRSWKMALTPRTEEERSRVGAIGLITFWLGFCLASFVCEVERRRLEAELAKERDSASFLAQVAALEWSRKQEAQRERVSAQRMPMLENGTAELEEMGSMSRAMSTNPAGEQGGSGDIISPSNAGAHARALQAELEETRAELDEVLAELEACRANLQGMELTRHKVNTLKVCLEVAKAAETKSRGEAEQLKAMLEQSQVAEAERREEVRKLKQENVGMRRALGALFLHLTMAIKPTPTATQSATVVPSRSNSTSSFTTTRSTYVTRRV